MYVTFDPGSKRAFNNVDLEPFDTLTVIVRSGMKSRLAINVVASWRHFFLAAVKGLKVGFASEIPGESCKMV